MSQSIKYNVLTPKDLEFLGLSRESNLDSSYDAWTKASFKFRADALCKEASVHKNYHENYFRLLNIGHKLRSLLLEEAC